MKKIIVFADGGDLKEYYDFQIEKGAQPNFEYEEIFGISGELRRTEIITSSGQVEELVLIQIHIGDILLAGREGDVVDIDNVSMHMNIAKENLHKQINTIQSEHIEQLEIP